MGAVSLVVSAEPRWRIETWEGDLNPYIPWGLSLKVLGRIVEMEAAKQNLLAKGGTLGDWTGLITNGLQPDAATHPGNVLDYARRVMNRDSIMEYECYDARGRLRARPS